MSFWSDVKRDITAKQEQVRTDIFWFPLNVLQNDQVISYELKKCCKKFKKGKRCKKCPNN